MLGQEFAPPGNIFDLPHIVPSEFAERMPHRSLSNMLSRGMIQQVEAVDVVAMLPVAVPSAMTAAVDFYGDPRVVKKGSGWWLVDGKQVHGRNAVKKALAELGG